MRMNHKRAIIGYSSKSVHSLVASIQSAYEKSKQALEAELLGLIRDNLSIHEEIAVRNQEIADQASLEKELHERLDQAKTGRMLDLKLQERYDSLHYKGPRKVN